MQYVIFGIILIAFAVLVIKSYAKKLAAGCCGAGGDTTKKVKVADKNKAHYPYAATLTVDGMMCAACETRVENALNAIDGVWAKASSGAGRVDVLMKAPVDEDTLRKTINDLGVYTLMKADIHDAKQN